MGLKYRKRINNGLSCYKGGTENILQTSGFGGLAGAMPYILLAQMIGSGIADAINIPSANDLISDAETSTQYSNGIAYLQINSLNKNDLAKGYRKASILNPLKWFGYRKYKKNIDNANRDIAAIDTTARAGAATDYLQQDYAQKHWNNDSVLYAKNGKDEPINAMTSGGESIVSADNKYAHQNPGPNRGDTIPSYVGETDTVFTANEKFPIAKIMQPAVQIVESINKRNVKNRMSLGKTTDTLNKLQAGIVLDAGKRLQKAARDAGLLPQPKLKRYKNGAEDLTTYFPFPDLPDPGLSDINLDRSLMKPLPVDYNANYRDRKTRRFPSNWWIDGLGVLTGLGLTIRAAVQEPKHPNTYAANPYSRNAINGLLGLNINPYPILKDMYDQQNRNLYAINRAGGLSGAQKAYANVASGIGMQNAIAKLEADIQSKNNAYKSNAYTATINAGQADRQAGMASNLWDLDYYSKSHAAKQQMTEQGPYNSLAALQQGYKNSFNRYMFDEIMNRYGA